MDESTIEWQNEVNDIFQKGFEYHIFLPIFLEKTFEK